MRGNGVLGRVWDFIVGEGGRTVSREVREMLGGERMLMERAESKGT
ncbi:UxaA family hydrolase, partial [Bacillus altitudinis]